MAVAEQRSPMLLRDLPAAQQMDGQRVTQDMGAAPAGHDARLVELAAQPGLILFFVADHARQPAEPKNSSLRRRRTIGQ